MHQHEINAVPGVTMWCTAEHISDFVQATAAKVGARVLPAALLDHVDDVDAHRLREVGEFGRVLFTAHHEHGATAGMVGACCSEEHAARTGQHVPLRHRDELGVSPISPMDEPSA